MVDWKGKKILIVDDCKLAGKAMVEASESIGLKVADVVYSASDALKYLKNHQVDFVSLDIIMPEMDGIECSRQIISNFPNILTFFVSALSSEQRVVDVYADEETGLGFLEKPINTVQLEKFLNLRCANLAQAPEIPPPPAT